MTFRFRLPMVALALMIAGPAVAASPAPVAQQPDRAITATGPSAQPQTRKTPPKASAQKTPNGPTARTSQKSQMKKPVAARKAPTGQEATTGTKKAPAAPGTGSGAAGSTSTSSQLQKAPPAPTGTAPRS